MIDVNLYDVLQCTQAAIPLLRGRPGAMICSVSSVGGRYGVLSWSVYSASKFAVVGFHDALRKELGQEGIRVTALEPGAVRTEFGANVAEAMAARWAQLEAMAGEDVAHTPLPSRRAYWSGRFCSAPSSRQRPKHHSRGRPQVCCGGLSPFLNEPRQL